MKSVSITSLIYDDGFRVADPSSSFQETFYIKFESSNYIGIEIFILTFSPKKVHTQKLNPKNSNLPLPL